MRHLSLTLIGLVACSAPARQSETSERYHSFTSVSPVLEPVTVEIQAAPSPALSSQLDRLAARVDMLRLQQIDPGAFTDIADPELQRRLFLRQLAAFDLRLMEFEEDHPYLDSSTLGRYESLVREPFRELQDQADE